MRWTPRLDKLEEAARKRRSAVGPLVVFVLPDGSDHPKIDGRTAMTESEADAYRQGLATGERGPLFIRVNTTAYLDL